MPDWVKLKWLTILCGTLVLFEGTVGPDVIDGGRSRHWKLGTYYGAEGVWDDGERV